MLKKIGLAVIVLLGALIVFVSMQPSRFSVERSTTMQAPADIPYGLVSDFHNWADWSPWDKLDPNMKKKYSGPQSGEGSSYDWEGSKDVGKGQMTMTAVKPDQSVDIKLEFLEPFEATNRTLFTFTPDGAGTKVTWHMEGNSNFVSKAMQLVADMDKMVGKDFEKGLASMKERAEADAAKRRAGVAIKPGPEVPQPMAADMK